MLCLALLSDGLLIGWARFMAKVLSMGGPIHWCRSCYVDECTGAMPH